MVIADAAAGFTGSEIAPEVTSFFCTSAPSMYFRKSAHAAVALVVQEKPSPPPSVVLGSPLPPLTAGKANQPSLELRFLSLVSAAIVLGSQSPWSSIAALPLATIPAELPAPCWAGVPRKPGWKGLVAMKAFVSSPAFVKHGSLRAIAFIDCLRTS